MRETPGQPAELWTEHQFRRLLEKLPAGAYICDSGGLITFYNDWAVELWGRAPKLHDAEDRFCGSFKLFHSAGRPMRHEEFWMARPRLIDDLMDVSRITRNKLELRRQRVTLAEVVRAAVETSRPLLEAEGHELTLSVPRRPILLDADSTRLAQAISNLLNNAARYTEPGGHVWLTAERQGGEALVSVKDTGIGIAAEMLPMVFELFAQGGRAGAGADGGLGIGLTLVKRLVEMHGGTVQAASGGLGQGSVFTVRLPIDEGPAGEPEKREGEGLAPTPPLRILVVDDNRDSAESLGMLFRLLGHEVRVAHDGLEAVAVAAELRPDAVVLDIGLPKLDGYGVAARIRGEEWGREATLIAVTGWGQEEDKERARAAGFDHHLVKPVDPTALIKLLSGSE
ncbi:MAG TPA: ATP-binding protein [Thermoanaerobaculia bacterium]|nr:ATP-binding protein [Thermoanaerobaculia bacterium]